MEGLKRTGVILTIVIIAAVGLGFFALFNWPTPGPEAPAAKPEAVIRPTAN